MNMDDFFFLNENTMQAALFEETPNRLILSKSRFIKFLAMGRGYRVINKTGHKSIAKVTIHKKGNNLENSTCRGGAGGWRNTLGNRDSKEGSMFLLLLPNYPSTLGRNSALFLV